MKPDQQASAFIKEHNLIRHVFPTYMSGNRVGDYSRYYWGPNREHIRIDFCNSDSGLLDHFVLFI